MFWEEKIDLIAKKHGPDGFKNPFTAWPDILKRIEDTFIIKTYDTSWEDSIKLKEQLATIEIKELDVMLSLLANNTNYWVVMLMGNFPTAKRHVYDCNPASLKDLIRLSEYSFFIVDKKYKWLTYFEYNAEKVTVFKSNISNSPFDKVN